MNDARPSGTHWDPGRYHKFNGHRLRPALELPDRVPIAEASLVCGLEGRERERFIEVYRERLCAAYPRRTGGHTLDPFRRLFMVAVRRG